MPLHLEKKNHISTTHILIHDYLQIHCIEWSVVYELDTKLA